MAIMISFILLFFTFVLTSERKSSELMVADGTIAFPLSFSTLLSRDVTNESWKWMKMQMDVIFWDLIGYVPLFYWSIQSTGLHSAPRWLWLSRYVSCTVLERRNGVSLRAGTWRALLGGSSSGQRWWATGCPSSHRSTRSRVSSSLSLYLSNRPI